MVRCRTSSYFPRPPCSESLSVRQVFHWNPNASHSFESDPRNVGSQTRWPRPAGPWDRPGWHPVLAAARRSTDRRSGSRPLRVARHPRAGFYRLTAVGIERRRHLAGRPRPDDERRRLRHVPAVKSQLRGVLRRLRAHARLERLAINAVWGSKEPPNPRHLIILDYPLAPRERYDRANPHPCSAP